MALVPHSSLIGIRRFFKITIYGDCRAFVSVLPLQRHPDNEQEGGSYQPIYINLNKKTMKLKLFLFMALAGIFFTSCSKDDDKEPVKSVADKVVGVYEVHTAAVSPRFQKPMENDGDKVTVTKVGENTVNIIYATKTWGAGAFEKVTVATSTDGKEYVISGEGMAKKMGMNPNNLKDYPATLKATIQDGMKVFNFKITVPSVMGGTVITFTPVSTTPQTGK